MRRAAFLDRDGVINRKAPEGQFITRWEYFEFLPGVMDAIRRLKQARFLSVIVTNQRCVDAGLLSIEALESIHSRMVTACAAAGAVIDAVYYCPHGRDSGCDCRKPLPGMLFRAAREHSIDLASSWMLGDSDADIEAGRSAGCKTARILGSDTPNRIPGDVTAVSLSDAVEALFALDQTSRRG